MIRVNSLSCINFVTKPAFKAEKRRRRRKDTGTNRKSKRNRGPRGLQHSSAAAWSESSNGSRGRKDLYTGRKTLFHS